MGTMVYLQGKIKPVGFEKLIVVKDSYGTKEYYEKNPD
jgi:hypothetical protein